MEAEIELLPGRAVGPFELGMSHLQIARLLEHLIPNGTVDDLGLQVKYDDRGLCIEIWIRVVDNIHSVILSRMCVNNFNLDQMIDLIMSQFPGQPSQSTYACHSWPTLGIRAVQWEASDTMVHSLVISAARTDATLFSH